MTLLWANSIGLQDQPQKPARKRAARRPAAATR